MKEGTDDTDALQHLQLTVSKGWIAATVNIETLKLFVSAGSGGAYIAKILQRQVWEHCSGGYSKRSS